MIRGFLPREQQHEALRIVSNHRTNRAGLLHAGFGLHYHADQQWRYKTAVVHSTFAAFIGVAFAMGVLLFSLLKERSAFRELIRESNNQITFSGGQLVLQMIQQAIPFIIVGSAISIFKLIDQYSFEKSCRS